MSFEKSEFARMSTPEFVAHLEKYNFVPTDAELASKPQNFIQLESDITLSILQSTGQRFGDAVPGETSGK